MRYPQSVSLSEQVTETIETQIIAGEYKIGDRLPTENNLAASFRVSRTVIREAMKVLKEKGWVETRPGRGTIVIDNVSRGVRSSFDVAVRMDPQSGSDHLIEIREMIEPEIAALAALRASEEHMSLMKQAIARMDQAVQEEPIDIDRFLDADFSFHIILAESTGNPLILMIVNPVVRLLREQQAFVSQVADGVQHSQSNHRLVLEAVLQRDPSAARETMRRHIIQVREDIRKTTTP